MVWDGPRKVFQGCGGLLGFFSRVLQDFGIFLGAWAWVSFWRLGGHGLG